MPKRPRPETPLEMHRDSVNAHLEFTSTGVYYQPLWDTVASRDVEVTPPRMVSLVSKEPSKLIDSDMFIHINDLVPFLVDSLKDSNATTFVIPLGALTQGSNVHFNVFLFNRTTLSFARFDPAVGADGRVYNYSAKINKAVIKAVSKVLRKTIVVPSGAKKASGGRAKTPPLEMRLFPLGSPCQRDSSCPNSPDPFCATWIILATDYIVSNPGWKTDNLPDFTNFNWYSLGKPLLKSWLRCKYKSIMEIGVTPKTSWYNVVGKESRYFFHYVKDGKLYPAPNINTEKCYLIIHLFMHGKYNDL